VTEPAQSLPQLAGRADRVLVVQGSQYDPTHRKANAIIAEERSSDSIQFLLSALDTEDEGAMDWTTPGTPTLVFLRQREVAATAVCLLPNYLRASGVWEGDRKLRNPEKLTEWLDEHNVPPEARR
jgi:predicted NAD/FAD-binding protein